ncbi:MAG: hypothetical protein M1419_04985 [Bacteroidetes bacterium]|nr:hypothetical protein [Patescibacteria group bacterium]MCL5991438.1 hypothetical protein [Bacteroidota bacterium]
MKKIIIIFEILVLVAASAFMHSCTEGSIYPTNTYNEFTSGLIDSGYYPNTVGSYWRYVVNYKSRYLFDTTTIILTSKVINGDGSQSLYYDNISTFSASQIIEKLKKDEVERQNIFSNILCVEKMKIPLSIGLSWTNNCPSFKDMSNLPENGTYPAFVESIDTLMINSIMYPAYKIVFNITDTTLAPNGIPYAIETQYFVPYVGFVKGTFEFMWDDVNRQYFEVFEWELNDFKIEKK